MQLTEKTHELGSPEIGAAGLILPLNTEEEEAAVLNTERSLLKQI